MIIRAACCVAILVVLAQPRRLAAADRAAASPVLKVPVGFAVELAAGPPLVERPIVAAFDDEGRLYVAESSGSNDPVQKQLAERPHRIVRLEDADDDGKFDRRQVFADRMMFPEGCLFLDGSLYVSAPPSIWKLTDADGDGVAEDRVEWFRGKTLTGCANDLHGPYVGPDGWLYWCKGAFAEQTHIVTGREWKSRAAHIFRCRLDGSGLEPVLTGGMDNPVDVVFTAEGERILSATFLVGEGRRDGLVHAIYGGVYGKDHGVLVGHPRTGELMPALVLMSPAAPCGLERYESDVFGAEYRDNLFVCQFNLRKVSRHVLRPAGSTFASEDSNFITSDNVDFHPTDVLMDADGSLLVIDTGGWYKLCCPTSQLWKPDVLGGIYRVRREGAATPVDPRGRRIAWSRLKVEHLWELLSDGRVAVRQRASRELMHWRDSQAMREFVAQLAKFGVGAVSWPQTSGGADSCDARTASLARVWVLSQVESGEALALIRQLLAHDDELIRHASMQAVSLHRDAKSSSQVIRILASDTAANRRIAAEALGRIGDASAVPHLLAAAAKADDRILQHSITYALIELADTTSTQAGLASESPRTVGAAVMALDQMRGASIEPKQVIPLLSSPDDGLRQTARWIVAQHVEWGGKLAEWFGEQLEDLPAAAHSGAGPANERALESMLVSFAAHPSMQQLLVDAILDPKGPVAAKEMALRVMAKAKLSEPPPSWRSALATVIVDSDSSLLPLAVAAAREFPSPESPAEPLNQALVAVTEASQLPQELRVAAMAVVSGSLPEVSHSQFELLIGALAEDKPVALRSAAADALSKARLAPIQLGRLLDVIESAGPLELNRLIVPFQRSTDEQLGLKLLGSLRQASALSSLRMDVVREALAQYGASVQIGVDEIESLVNVDAAVQRRRIEELLPEMAQGDLRRGHAVFHGSKAACSSCHRLGYVGGAIGPELTRIGEIRTERDLLESILYPSLSFVRSYEPVLIITVEGRTINGNILDETAEEYVLAIGLDQEVRVRRDDVEEMHPGTISTMPAGLDQQLTAQELADLVAFLKNARGE